MSLLVEVKIGWSSSGSSLTVGFGSGIEIFAGFGAGAFFVSVAAPSPAPPLIQTTFCVPILFGSRLHRINPTRSTTCAIPISPTLRQKRVSFEIIYFVSALVATPTFVMSARCNASISEISFCTGNSRSGRITTATSGLVRFSSINCAVSASGSTI